MAHTNRPSLQAVIMVVALLATGSTFHSNAKEPPKRTVLQNMMRQLGHDMQAATGAISREDWPAVVGLAPNIANHPQPSLSEKMRIFAWLGTDAARFREFDAAVHKAAVSMGEAAERGDGQAVIHEFSLIQQSCLACHRRFRNSFREHFYEER